MRQSASLSDLQRISSTGLAKWRRWGLGAHQLSRASPPSLNNSSHHKHRCCSAAALPCAAAEAAAMESACGAGNPGLESSNNWNPSAFNWLALVALMESTSCQPTCLHVAQIPHTHCAFVPSLLPDHVHLCSCRTEAPAAPQSNAEVPSIPEKAIRSSTSQRRVNVIKPL